MLKPEEKKEVMKDCKIHDKDTGSPEVQISLLSEEIKRLLEHLKTHPKDFHSKRGLLKMVSDRRKFLKYLKGQDEKRYEKIIKKLGIKK